MSILEGLVKAESNINPDTDISTNIDMSNKTGDTYNIEKAEIHIHIGNQIFTDKELARELTIMLLQRQQRPVVETQDTVPRTP